MAVEHRTGAQSPHRLASYVARDPAWDAPVSGAVRTAHGVGTVWMASQAVTFHHRGVVEVLGLPPEKVRLVHVSPGGGFGARNDMSLHPYLALDVHFRSF